ncbi:unnamed protein product [Durusdinium trenchii]|uniref:Uncharacterized protein n=2 Tax=Durusdinium trenchii TaxID=1381693 RepID=A0ABP0K1C5_9DINO
MASLLSKTGKLRSLIRDLKTNYSKSENFSANIKSLQEGIKSMDAEYDKCHDVWAKGELKSFIEQPHDDLHSLSLRRCSRVMAAEMKIKSEPHAMLRKSITYCASQPSAQVTSYRASIRTAKGVVDDIGSSCAAKSPGLGELARVPLNKSERDGFSIMTNYDLCLPVKVTTLAKASGVSYPGGIDVLRLTDWLDFIVEYGCFHVLCGLQRADIGRCDDILNEFWKRYKRQFPDHDLFKIAERHAIPLHRIAPLYLHGDEGRGKKRLPILVLSWHSCLGGGTQSANRERKKRERICMRLNFTGSCYTHRLLAAVLPRMTKEDAAFQSILETLADDASQVLLKGATDSAGRTFYAACLGVTGDWMFLAKAGNLARTYGHCIKRPLRPTTKQVGICHLCLAGTREIPFEMLQTYERPGSRPPWWNSRGANGAFDFPISPLNRIPCVPNFPEMLYVYDLFHCYHLGMGRYFLGSVLALMSERCSSTKAADRFDELTQLYLSWCEEEHRSPYLQSITQAKINWLDTKNFPVGLWTKGHVTLSLNDFVSAWGQQQDFANDDILKLCVEANCCIRSAIQRIFARDTWLSKNDALYIAHEGLQFLSKYGQLALRAFRDNRALFSHAPKEHPLEHIFYELKHQGERLDYVLSPGVTSVQPDEDFVGKVSRTSRRTNAEQAVRRTVQRTLMAANHHWTQVGYISR